MRTYRQKSGFTVVVGKIKSFSDDRMVMIVETEERQPNVKESTPLEFQVTSAIPFEDAYKPGYTVTAAGWPRGKNVIGADSVMIGNDHFETQDIAIVTGFVKFARMNEEKNSDGTQKMKQDGVTPKKPHFDITVSVKEGDKFVDHIVKVYEGKTEPGKTNQMERMAKLFSKFDRDTNRIAASIVTSPGSYDSYTTTKNGMEYTNNVCYHMGVKTIDVDFVDQKEKGQSTPVNSKPQLETKESNVSNSEFRTPNSELEVSAQPGNAGTGFDNDLDINENELFT